jgi:pyrimidine-specific ribonucleoside hydrolase
MELVIETDLGRDPDDYFAILYLVSAGVDIKLICISPGDPDQIAVARFLIEMLGINPKIGVGKQREGRSSCSGFHLSLLSYHGAPLTGEADGLGSELMETFYTPETELFVCGPLNSVGNYFGSWPSQIRGKATMQGGFLAYDSHHYNRCKRLKKFEGKSEAPTFNLNGDRRGAEVFLKAPITDRRFVSKNVCHTVIYDQAIHERFLSIPPNNLASQLIREGMTRYLKKHPEGKKFHDPTAAVAHLHPEVIKWVRGKLYTKGGKWGWNVNNSKLPAPNFSIPIEERDGPIWSEKNLERGQDHISADIDRGSLWFHLMDGV